MDEIGCVTGVQKTVFKGFFLSWKPKYLNSSASSDDMNFCQNV